MDNRDARIRLANALDKRATAALYEKMPAVMKLFNDLREEVEDMELDDSLFNDLVIAHMFYDDFWSASDGGSGAVFINRWLGSGDPLPEASSFIPELREWVIGYLDAAEQV